MGMISATMIVRDEERFLPACLDSIAPLVDEIVVVDTGSQDRTREIAINAGARVIDFPWIDDFSAARNVAIDHARFDWMLYIDADERIRPIDRGELARELQAPDLLDATVMYRPKSGYTAYREHRLIRRDPRIRFHGAIHESFIPDIERLVKAGLGRVGTSSLTIDHLGYDGDQSHKLERNLTLLPRQIEAAPDRAYLRWHLGTVLRDSGRLAEAEASWRVGARLARETLNQVPDAAMCAIELAKLALEQGRDPSDSVADGLATHPGNWLLLWIRAKGHLAAGAFEQARPIFEALAEVDAATLVDHMSYDQRIFGAWALQELAEDAFQRAAYTDAAALFARAMARDPTRLELRAKHALAAARAGGGRP